MVEFIRWDEIYESFIVRLGYVYLRDGVRVFGNVNRIFFLL